MLTDNFFVVAYKSGNGFQDELCHHLPGYQAKVDWPVVPCSLLEDRSDTCFPPDLRHLSQLLWPLKDLWEWPYTDSFLTTCGCVPSRPMSLGVSSWLKYSLTGYFSTEGASSLGQPFSLASETWDSQRAALLVKAEVKEAFSSSAFSSLGPSSHQALGFLQASPIPRQSPMHSNGSLI